MRTALASSSSRLRSGRSSQRSRIPEAFGDSSTTSSRGGGSTPLGRRRLWLGLSAWSFSIESSITVLVAGAVARPLFDRYRVSREKLAYLIDSTSAAVCILIPLNAWGAYNLGILSSLEVPDPLGVFWWGRFP